MDFKNFDGMDGLFRSCYGIDDSLKNSNNENESFQKAIDTFRSSFSSYVNQMGWVPVKEHDDLKNELKKLKKEVGEQKVIIEQLNNLLGIKKVLEVVNFFNKYKILV